ncbi:Tetratricopeptide repeat-containing protein [Robiginitalea myxolifaciens]|uniref:Tetratricopeptide repeat-containing protein n=1 Tax=Robiginitalea myxolifaciens TaxID=400055 RepID=A0A1I6FSZ0_9FLAO|nr:histidine kinase [Robiginitalea myxolifaciens]SFR33018.1 Tetratricopeptide repeat-containing protein [Robiginitalea myxolifaciens]
MKSSVFTILLCFLSLALSAQTPSNLRGEFELKGKVVTEVRETPIPGISVSTDQGAYTLTNQFGEFKIMAAAGDMLIVSDPDMETVRYRIRNNEDIKILVRDIEPETLNRAAEPQLSKTEQHRQLLDSALHYKQLDIERSLAFVTRSIELLDGRSYARELAASLTTLGEIYQFHQQYDLAISNYREALEQFDSSRTLLLLGKTYVLNEQFQEALDLLLPEADRSGLIPFQRLELYEILGDAYGGLEQVNTAVSLYQRALTVAEKNQLVAKVPVLNSKIAMAYDNAERPVEAEAYFSNSLEEAKTQNPSLAVLESENLADFFQKRSRFQEEITQRKESLEKLKAIGATVILPEADSITVQGINYKIGAAYLAQSRFQEAIPYLSESIREAGSQGDLVIQKDATRKLSEAYRDQGNFERAMELYQEYVALVDTLYVRKEQELSQAARFSRQMATSQDRIRTLEQDRLLSKSKYDLALAEQQLSIENNRQQRIIIYSLIFGLLLTALAAFLYYRSNRQKELSNHLLALKGLRSQMNPHFIFNALNSVNNYIARNDERSANRYLSDFSRLMRTVLENSEKDFIPLTEELELLELYLKLEHSRFPDKFDYEIEVDPEVNPGDFGIPPMLLQPYLENAVWHGLRYKEEKGYLRLRLSPVVPGVLQIEISDNGIGRKQSAALKTPNQQRQKSRGMGNIKRRIEILNKMYGDRITVSVRDLNTDGTGTLVQVTLRS